MDYPIKQYTLRVAEPAQVLDFLIKNMNGKSRNSIKQLIAHKCVWLGDKHPLSANDHLQAGDVVAIRSQKAQHKTLQHPLLKVVYEDDQIMIVEKREGLLSVATDREKERTAYHILNEHVKQFEKNRNIYIVHRLDRETSGVMVFAKTPSAQEKLRENWNDTVVERSYIAVVEGKITRDGTVDTYLYEDSKTFVHSSPVPVEGGLRSVTHYKVLKTNGRRTLLQLDLETGRTNQIRVHMQSLGHPVVGDGKYGSIPNPRGRMLLHAFSLAFYHPTTGELLRFEMKIPKEFDWAMK